jgi:hypothetical protein
MHGSDITAAMRAAVRHLPPDEAALALSAAWTEAARKHERRVLWAVFLAGATAGMAAFAILEHA